MATVDNDRDVERLDLKIWRLSCCLGRPNWRH